MKLYFGIVKNEVLKNLIQRLFLKNKLRNGRHIWPFLTYITNYEKYNLCISFADGKGGTVLHLRIKPWSGILNTVLLGGDLTARPEIQR